MSENENKELREIDGVMAIVDKEATDPLAVHEREIAEKVIQEVYTEMRLAELDADRVSLNKSYEKDKAELIRTGSMGVVDKGLEDYYGAMHDENKIEYQRLVSGKVNPESARAFLRSHGDEFLERVSIAEKLVPERASQLVALDAVDAELEALERQVSNKAGERAGASGRFPGRKGVERGIRTEMQDKFAAIEAKRVRINSGDFGSNFDQSQVDLRKQYVDELYSFGGDDRGMMEIASKYKAEGLVDTTPPDDLHSKKYTASMDKILSERMNV